MMRPRPNPGGCPRRQRGDRAVSDLVGFVLIFGLVVSVVAIVSLAGMGSLESVRTAEQSQNAERAMEILADNMDDIHQRGAPSRATEISLEGASVRLGDEIQVIVRDSTDGGGDDSTFLTSRVFQVRPIIYDDGETELVYVMGAVFRDDRQGGTVVEHYSPVLDDDRALVPVVRTVSASSGSQQIQSSTVLVRASAIKRNVPVASTNDSVRYDHASINVSSPRQELWNRTLSRQDRLSCSQNDPDWVNCSLEPTTRLFVTETAISVEITE